MTEARNDAGGPAVPDREQILIVINCVRADRADAFEEWLRSVVAPAVREHQPHLEGRWRVLRGTEAQDDVVLFTFLLHGGTDEDWALEPLLERALGPHGADRALRDMQEMVTQDQHGWWASPVRLQTD